MPYYAQVSPTNKVLQLFFQVDGSAIPGMQEQFPNDKFIETKYFGDADCFAYENGQIVPVERPVRPQEIIAKNRQQRNVFLSTSDWTQLPDVPLAQAVKDTWATYRQALRSMTEQNLLDGAFPARPAPAVTSIQGATNS